MKTKILFFSLMFLAGVMAVFSCKKDDDKTVTKQDAVSIAKNDATADVAYNDIYSESEEILTSLEKNKYPASGSLKSASLTGSRTITVTQNSGDTANYPKEIVVSYSDYISNSGLKKNGQIKITQSDKFRKSGAVRTVTLTNYIINDTILIEGTKTITNLGLVNAKPSIKDELKDGKITFAGSGYFITRSFTRTITWTTGFLTPFNVWDDIYTISATAKGSSKNGLNYSSKTTEDLEYQVKDFCIKKGKIEVDVEGQKKVYLDFNRTDCITKVKLVYEGDVENVNI